MEGKRKLYIHKGKFSWQYSDGGSRWRCGDWVIIPHYEPHSGNNWKVIIPGTTDNSLFYTIEQAKYWCETHRLAEVIGAPKSKVIIQQPPTEEPIIDILKQIMVQKAMQNGMPARNELALSSDWRITKSSVKAIDMANALQSLRTTCRRSRRRS